LDFGTSGIAGLIETCVFLRSGLGIRRFWGCLFSPSSHKDWKTTHVGDFHLLEQSFRRSDFWLRVGSERVTHLMRWTHMAEPGKEGGSTSSPSALPIVVAFQLYFLACDTSEQRREFWLSHGMDMSPSDTPGVEMIFFFTNARFWVFFLDGACWGWNAGTHTLSSLDVSFFFQIDFEKRKTAWGSWTSL